MNTQRPLTGEDATPLNIISKEELEMALEAAIYAGLSGYSKEQFEKDLAEFVELKKRKQMH